MQETWRFELRGGPYDGEVPVAVAADERPLPAVLVAWLCNPFCGGHIAEPDEPSINPRTAVAYRLEEEDAEARRAVYVVGEMDPPELEEDVEALAGQGASTSGFRQAAEALRRGWERGR